MLKWIILSGSSRHVSQTTKVSKFIKRKVEELYSEDVKTEIIDLKDNPFPLWEEKVIKKEWLKIETQLDGVDGMIVVSPEWGGMAPPGLKNFFLHATYTKQLAHVPALIVSLSSGAGGAFPVAELRSSSYKNTKLLYIPEHVIIRDVKQVFNSPSHAMNKTDEYIQERMEFSLKLLFEYSEALKPMRKTTRVDLHKYQFGMS